MACEANCYIKCSEFNSTVLKLLCTSNLYRYTCMGNECLAKCGGMSVKGAIEAVKTGSLRSVSTLQQQ